jgi:hypothetical protein
MKDDKQILLVAQKNAAGRSRAREDIYQSARSPRAAAAEAAGRHREGAGRGQAARAHRQAFVRQRRVLRRRTPRCCRRSVGVAGDRGAGARRDRAVRRLREAEQEDPAESVGGSADRPTRPSWPIRSRRASPVKIEKQESCSSWSMSSSGWRRSSASWKARSACSRSSARSAIA